MLESLREIWQFRPLIMELVRRDLKLRYKNSIGGIAWSLLNPLMQILVITLVMKFISARPIENYSGYLFGIIFIWNFFSVTLSDSCVSILSNHQLVRKVYFPRAILPMATLLGNLFHFAISFGFTLIYFFCIVRAYPQNLRWVILLVIPVILFTSMLSLGISYVLAYLNVFYEDVRFIINALLQLAFYTMPVFFTIEKVAAKGYFELYMLNPIAALVVTYQRALLPPPPIPGLEPVDISWPFFGLACLTSVVVLIVGFALFEKHQWEMAERL